jgi:hypothetical protein
MIRINKIFAQKKSAQAMVEFAIALPVLLLLLYGILEAGRLLFLYSTVVTASRQAARYGSATGDGNNSVPRYQDCRGIRDAANAVAYLGKFDDAKIVLQYDAGPGTPLHNYCSSTVNSDSSLNTNILEGNRTRLIVTITTRFYPIVPKLVPFIERDITASSARTILYSVPIVVEQQQQEWYKNPTTTLITLDDPDPSEINGAVKVSVQVTGGSPAPTGFVDITGADNNCQIPLSGSGTGSCDVVFTTAGAKVITAFYEGDTNSLASSDTEDHTVTLYNTVTTITSDLPDPSTKDQEFVVAVTVTGGNPVPGGTVTISGGGNAGCSFPLSMGMGSCKMSFPNLGQKTLTASYSGDSLHLPSSDTEIHDVLVGTATPTSTPTKTPIPSPTLSPTATIIPTATPSPTLIPTAVPACNLITTPGNIKISGNVMSITINNPYNFTLVMSDITVTWNDDKGHQTGGNKKLQLQKITVGSQNVWSGTTAAGQSTLTVPTNATVPSGNTTVSFYFNQTYDSRDGTENVLINWLTPGCTGNPLNVK